ncbi:TIGR03862 family flavoprotein [Kaistella flava (ex Peng et al. 2021)]|uniref:TIGR03862 family flavoprotein n=1 Tax=Kaistella flava (ex Peng et al. 2021) TaxID=2038776 RepID=A0A7M2Y9Z0_9FLAO|nr:TIGR03862 family flavoprotein [Kaistella flava (ex Peng et al. 2021)]QOW10465.1 TIGR03862 family flavoprotein [Kaistella flava (ex Peng et al. 2021)]
MNGNQIIIIGAGPAGLMAAQQLALKGFKVQVYEQNKAAARKFLVAGNGGFNLTHSEELESFVKKYEAKEIQEIVKNFDNQKVIQWLSDLGVTTYVGSSGKIFPTKNFKPIQVLKAWLDELEKLGVTIHYDHTFMDFDDSSVYLKSNDQDISIKYSELILAMGGGSWKKTGSDAKWVETLSQKNIEITPLESANSGYNTNIKFHQLQGQYLKNIKVSFEDQHKIGEVVFTKYGIEGSPIYYLNRFTRKHDFPVTINIDLKPNLRESEILEQLKGTAKISSVLKRNLKLSTTAINLLKTLDKESYLDIKNLAKTIKKFPIEVLSFRPIDEVISTSGGVAFSALNPNLQLKNFPNVYCAGEMIDWEAPTGGYLLQACFSTGFWVANTIANS